MSPSEAISSKRKTGTKGTSRKDRTKRALGLEASLRGFEIAARFKDDAEVVFDRLTAVSDQPAFAAELEDSVKKALKLYRVDSEQPAVDLMLSNQLGVLMKFNQKLPPSLRLSAYRLEANIYIGPWMGSFTGLGITPPDRKVRKAK